MRVLVVLALAAALASCGGSDTPTAQEAAPATTAASRLAGPSLDGESISLDDFRGRPVLLNVWSAW